jgi:type I restriction enzyme R subunit
MHESEWQTRRLRIDARLRSLSPAWEIIPWRAGLDVSRLECHIVTEIPTENGPADYGFFVRGLFLGILEGKKVAVNPQNVLEQAWRYSKGAFVGPGNWRGYRVPFLFASNGEIIWFLDVRRERAASRLLSNFHTAPALAEMFAFDAKTAFDWLSVCFSQIACSALRRSAAAFWTLADACRAFASRRTSICIQSSRPSRALPSR